MEMGGGVNSETVKIYIRCFHVTTQKSGQAYGRAGQGKWGGGGGTGRGAGTGNSAAPCVIENKRTNWILLIRTHTVHKNIY